jgi:linoleoyl-CoA desaturase
MFVVVTLWQASVLGSFLFAITGWLMGALGHDAGHFAASRNAGINEWGVWAMFFICNPILWQHQHTYGHHSFTNEFGHDPDLHHFDLLLRVHKRIRYESHFRFQRSWPYVMFAYLFVVFGTCFYIPWGVLTTGTLYGVVDWTDRDRPTKRWGMRLGWYLYILIVMIVPLCTHPTWPRAVLSIYLHIATLGLVFAFFSQINHLNEPSLESDMDTRQSLKATTEEQAMSSQRQQQPQGNNRCPQRNSLPLPSERRSQMLQLRSRDPRLVHSWAAAQVETSNNFASQSLLWHILSNGLNHQIEHHLFPALNHAHLHRIAPVVRATCEEFGVRYKSYDTWSDLMAATLDWFDKLGVDDGRPAEVRSGNIKKAA